jgi:hypothetical protein
MKKRLEPLTITEYKLICLIRNRQRRAKGPLKFQFILSRDKLVCQKVTPIIRKKGPQM